jgi:hypothetical protein
MTIYDIKRETAETAPHFFDRQTLRFFGQTMKSFTVSKAGGEYTGKYWVRSAMFDKNGKQVGITERLYNPQTKTLERVSK